MRSLAALYITWSVCSAAITFTVIRFISNAEVREDVGLTATRQAYDSCMSNLNRRLHRR